MKQDDAERTLEGMIHLPTLKLRLAIEGIFVGLFAGCCIALLRLCLGFVASRRSFMVAFLQSMPLASVLIWAVALLVLAWFIAYLVRLVPIAGGSGIPQIRGIVLGIYQSLHWFRVIVVKLVATALGIGAGLSMGREGPSVQIGGMAGQGIGRLFHNSNMETRALISSGAGAGLAAAFNAPMAGCLFTMEVIHKNLSALVMVPTLMASLTAAVVSMTLLTAVCPGDFLDCLYEVVSAIGTVGLSRGLTENLNTAGKAVIIGTMFLGRIGPVSLSMFFNTSRFQNLIVCAEEPLSVG